MNHSNSNRLRLTGKLTKGSRHYVLQCEDETMWRLNFQDLDIPEENKDVIIEGFKAGFDAVDVDWVGPKHAL
ncbi:MAG: hypothetical protein GW808_02145 [Sphingomonadales bacterium]|nr:hypothetical protein [Sphingomonadales bacterium]NCO47909.1 hypothetical protein [Sphingomonadales bacterium]NCO99206.1 hypothetical protein [Sphingomonadales bacterium]NCP27611.1 hypothetical protein [Sphingomonadales bacterium]NCP42231.1 hypothetical protein [Sphingomonadales bacterium]|tara:strand:+ start:668 stop:883 length:216 start_codon:yes stop_codon:yes gene_type:complete